MCVFVRQHDKRENLLLTLTKVSRSHGHTTQTNPACEPIPNQSSLAGDAWLVQSPSTSSSVRTTVGALLPRAGWVEKYSARFVFFCLSGFGVFHRLFPTFPPSRKSSGALPRYAFGGGRVAGSWVYTCFVSRRLATGVVQPAPELKIVRPLQSVSSSLVCAFADKSHVEG